MSTKRLFRQDHPLLFGLIILGAMFMVFCGGIAFLLFKAIQPGPADLFGNSNSIGVIALRGVLVSSEETIRNLTDFRNNDDIKAVIVRIDSPGGAVGASQEIFEEIKRTSKVKPVVASMASVAASGGYYAALGANKIVANPGTLTGSIGVILKFANIEKILDKVGYKPEVIKSGSHKDIGSLTRAMTVEERALLQELINNVHQQFMHDVAVRRDLPPVDVEKLADGRIFTGMQAQDFGLIDELGNFTTAIELAKNLAGLKGMKTKLVYPHADQFSIFNILTGEKSQALLDMIWQAKPAIMYEWSL